MKPTIKRRARFARALGSRPFALLWLGQTVSALGDGAFYTAMAWQVLLLTGSASALGGVLVAQSIPRLIFLLLGGVMADRLPRRLVLLWSDGGRAVAVLAIATLGWAHALQLWHLVALALFFGVADAFFLPAYQSIPPQLVAAEALPSANALTGLSQQLSLLIGPALGAACVSLAGPPSAFALDGASFVVSAGCLMAMRLQGTAVATPRARAARRGAGGMLAEVREGLGYVLREPWLWVTISIASLGNVALAPLEVSLPVLVRSVYRDGVWLLGALLVATAIGSMAATLLVGQMHRLRRRGLVAYCGLIVSSVALAGFGLPLAHAIAPAVTLGLSAAVGFGLGLFSIIWVTVMQELVPPDKLGRVTSLDWLGSFALQPVGLGLVGVLTDRVGASWVFLGGGVISLALTLIGLSVPGIRHLD